MVNDLFFHIQYFSHSRHSAEGGNPCGLVDWKDAMHGLALAGFDGLFNYELSVYKVPDGIREAFAAYTLASARELISLIK